MAMRIGERLMSGIFRGTSRTFEIQANRGLKLKKQERNRDRKLQEKGMTVLKFDQMPEGMQKLVSKIAETRKGSMITSGMPIPFAIAPYFYMPAEASGIITAVVSGYVGAGATAFHKLNSSDVRKKMAELERHLKRKRFSGYRKGRDIFIVYGKNIHFIPGSRLQIAIAKAQRTFLRHCVPYRYVGILNNKKVGSYP